MWSSTDILNVTKQAVAEVTGVSDIAATGLNVTALADIGEKIGVDPVTGEVTNTATADLFFKSLLSQVGKVVVDTRAYVAQLPSLFVDPTEWGLISEYIKIDLADVMVDEMWNANGFIPYTAAGGPAEAQRIAGIAYGCYKPAVNAKIFKKAKGVMVALTVAREQMFTAFSGVAQYEQFVAGLFNAVENTLQLKAEVYALMTVSAGIATADHNNNVVHLLTDYANETGKTPPSNASKALSDNTFMAYALKRISETRDYLKRMTVDYNNHQTVTFSSDSRLILLSAFSSAAKFGVRANTYNEELLGIGDYDRVASWQAVTTSNGPRPYDITTASEIILAANAADEIYGTTTQTPKTISNVIGVLYDRQAMGVTLDKRKVTSNYSAPTDTTNYFYHSLVNYVVNDNYPIVVFALD